MIDIRNPKQYCEHFLKIRDKKGNIIPLRLKPAQEMLYQIIKEEHGAAAGHQHGGGGAVFR